MITLDLTDINCYTANWTAVIQVIEATHIFTTKQFSNEKMYRRFLLANSQVYPIQNRFTLTTTILNAKSSEFLA